MVVSILSICRHVQNSRAAVLTSLKLLLSFLSTPVLSHTMLLNAVCGDEEVTSPPFGFTLPPLFAIQTDTHSSWPWMHPAISFSFFFVFYRLFSLFSGCFSVFSCPNMPIYFVSSRVCQLQSLKGVGFPLPTKSPPLFWRSLLLLHSICGY